MSDEATYDQLMASIEEAQRTLDQAKAEEKDARHRTSTADNRLVAAEKAFVDHLVKTQPRLTEMIKMRSR